MSTNISAIAVNTTGFASLTQGINTHIVGGWFGTMILMTILVIMFMAFMKSTNDTNRSVGATCFIALILSLIMRALILIPDVTLYITVVAAAGGMALVWKSGD